MKRIIRKHPIAIRWFHWLNFPLIAVMIWSGILIYWANGVYYLGWNDRSILKFFPDSFYKALNIPYNLANGMALHFVFMWFFAINGLLYFLYITITGEWRYIFPGKSSFKEAWQVLLYDLHLRKKKPLQGRYNAAQKIAYSMVILMGFGSLLTGLAIYKPVQFHWITAMLGGYEWARVEHFMLNIGFILFFIIHILQVIKTGWSNFQGMITGFEIKKEQVDSDETVRVNKFNEEKN